MEIDYSAKVEVTTVCPTCNRPYIRMVYKQQFDEYPGTLCLTMCEECVVANSDEDGNMVIKMVIW